MYQVLYRKWRPKLFSDVVGQPQVTVTLRNELKSQRVAHAYLFTGSRGTGKTTCAKILAKAINCLDPKEGDPCGVCDNCKGIENGSILDVVEIDAASNNGVENIRSLREEASFTPSAAKYRVYIIDEVHMLSIGAFNALLKTLEEPPAHVVFILATTEVHKLPATILSRCQRFDFHRIDPESIANRLTFICKQENKMIDHDAALLIAQLSDGALRDALSLLDQSIGKQEHITADLIRQTAGLAGRNHLFSLSDAVLEQNSKKALDVIRELYESSKDMQRLLEELLGHFRNIMLFQTMGEPKELIILSKEDYEKTRQQAAKISLETTLHVLDGLQTSLSRMSFSPNKRTELEMCFIRLCSPELDDTKEALLHRIAKLERAFRSGFTPSHQSEQANESQPTASTETEQAHSSADITEPIVSKQQNSREEAKESVEPSVDPTALQAKAKKMQDWPEVLKVLKTYSQVIATAFHGSTAYTSGNFVLIDAPNSMAFELLRKSAQRDKMRIAIKEVTGRVYKLGPYKSACPTAQDNKDPLEELEMRAAEAGIPVTKNLE